MRDGPSRMLSDNRIFVRAELLQQRQKTIVAAIGHCDHGVSAQTTQLSAFHWRAAKQLAKFFHAKLHQPCEVGIHQLGPGLKIGQSRHRCMPVPWADILADVAAENLPANTWAQFLRNRVAQLDGQIRNALGRIHFIGRRKSIRWARVQASCARAAVVGGRKIGVKLQRRENDA